MVYAGPHKWWASKHVVLEASHFHLGASGDRGAFTIVALPRLYRLTIDVRPSPRGCQCQSSTRQGCEPKPERPHEERTGYGPIGLLGSGGDGLKGPRLFRVMVCPTGLSALPCISLRFVTITA